MSETKVFNIPENGGYGSNGLVGLIAPLLQQRGLDPNMVFAMMNNGKNNGGFGDGSMFWWVIFLFFLMGWGGNGWGGGFGGQGGVQNQLSNDVGRQMLMDAIQRNGTDISALASNLNCSVGQIQTAINQVQSLIQGVSNQVGLTGQQIISTLSSQLCECCCNVRSDIAAFKGSIELQNCQNTNALTNAINFVNSSVERGFASTQYETQAQTNAITKAISDQTAFINQQFCNLEMREMQNKIDSLRLENQTLKFAESQQAQNNYLINQLQPVAKPAYLTCSPYQAAQFPYGAYGYPYGGNNGCNCGCGV